MHSFVISLSSWDPPKKQCGDPDLQDENHWIITLLGLDGQLE